MPVWRYPIVGAQERTVSPSSSSTRRSTPCVLGCCGPMLMVMVSVRMSGMSLQTRYCRGHGNEQRTPTLHSLHQLVSVVALFDARGQRSIHGAPGDLARGSDEIPAP